MSVKIAKETSQFSNQTRRPEAVLKKSLERSKENPYSGFKKRKTEEFYDSLTSKLIELLCYRLLISPSERNLFLCGPSSNNKQNDEESSQMN